MEKDLGDRLVHPSLAFCSAHYFPQRGGLFVTNGHKNGGASV